MEWLAAAVNWVRSCDNRRPRNEWLESLRVSMHEPSIVGIERFCPFTVSKPCVGRVGDSGHKIAQVNHDGGIFTRGHSLHVDLDALCRCGLNEDYTIIVH